ncbi:MAG TPA: rod shape-determining protein RodA, partial [Sphingomonas sp.]
MSGRSIIPEPVALLAWRALLPVLGLGCFGLVVLYSAAGGSLHPWALSQGVKFFAFLGGAVILSYAPLDWFKRLAFPGYAALLIALLLVEMLGA